VLGPCRRRRPSHRPNRRCQHLARQCHRRRSRRRLHLRQAAPLKLGKRTLLSWSAVARPHCPRAKVAEVAAKTKAHMPAGTLLKTETPRHGVAKPRTEAAGDAVSSSGGAQGSPLGGGGGGGPTPQGGGEGQSRGGGQRPRPHVGPCDGGERSPLSPLLRTAGHQCGHAATLTVLPQPELSFAAAKVSACLTRAAASAAAGWTRATVAAQRMSRLGGVRTLGTAGARAPNLAAVPPLVAVETVTRVMRRSGIRRGALTEAVARLPGHGKPPES